MSSPARTLDADVVIAGAGPGGCLLARDLARAGKQVVLVERGGLAGKAESGRLACLRRLEKELHLPFPVRRTLEGHALILGQGVGGGTLVFAGSAFPPDLEPEALGLEAEILQQQRDGLRPGFGAFVAVLVMAIAEVAAAHEHSVGAALGEDQEGRQSSAPDHGEEP